MSERKRDKMELKALEGEVTAALVENAQLLEKYGDTKGAVEVWDKLIDRWGSAPWAWSIAGSAQYALSEKMRIVAEHGPLP
jgi:Tfp pilus assembly protein PilE